MKQSTLTKEFEDSKINCENLSDPLEVTKQEKDTNVEVEELVNEVSNFDESQFGIDEQIQIEQKKDLIWERNQKTAAA